MATINATLNLTSSDLTSSPLALSKTMTMHKAGSCNGLELTSGLVRRNFTSTNQVDLVAVGAQNYGTPTAEAARANKLYIKNTSSSSTEHVKIGVGNSSGSGTATSPVGNATTYWELGRLYGSDWMMIPFNAASAVGDITIQPSTAEEVTVEYMLFFE